MGPALRGGRGPGVPATLMVGCRIRSNSPSRSAKRPALGESSSFCLCPVEGCIGWEGTRGEGGGAGGGVETK